VVRTAPAANPAQAPAAEALIAQARLGGRVSYAVLDARTGALLEGREPTATQPPASVAKAVTALYAMDRLGAGFRFSTRVLATGPVEGGRLRGDLILLGGGDPTLTTDGLGDLAAALRARGLREISGRFLLHAGALPGIPTIDPGQPDHVGYSPAISGLNLNYNRVHFEWRRAQGGWQVSMDARAERFVPAVRMARMRIVQREAPLFTYAARDRAEDWTVAASALGKGGSRWLPVRQPALYAGEVFQTLAAAQGIRLPEPQVLTGGMPGGTVLAEVTSAQLPELLREMLRWSTNITAEALGLAASGASSLSASGARMSEWLAGRFGVEARFVDHSGLGDTSRISAVGMAQVLLRAGAAGPLRGMLRDFGPRKGSAAPVRAAAKTGTLNFVSGLGGYVTAPAGRDLVFAVFAADTARRDALRGTERERPAGGPQWTRRAREMQAQLIERWAAVYG
jgi:D-alanyl-D-alanine carboxypeptidase/D-alanyl-D-alanine-endopeptidase (penicillin-binding protein 4)